MATATLNRLSSSFRFIDTVDLWAAGLALPFFLVAGWPILGWIVGVSIWLGQRLVQALFRSKVAQAEEPRRIVGLIAGSTMIRAWGAALLVLIVGLQNEEVGLAAALLIVALFTVYFASSLLQRLIEGDRAGAEKR